MKIEQLLDTDLLIEHVKNGYVSRREHPTLPLMIYNYTSQAQAAGLWGDGTIDYCRGLIIDQGGNVIARPFKKFHNLNTPSIPETMEENLPDIVPEITEKYDGSLGILYTYDGQTAIATRGSFTSDQAKWATNRYRNHYIMPPKWSKGFTPLFEIIYPENRIVVEYDFSGLVLIGMVNIETGAEMSYHELNKVAKLHGLRCAESVETPLSYQNDTTNREGCVLTYYLGECPPLKVKVKFEEYVRLHRMVTGMNPRSVWETLSTDGDLGRFQNTPAPFKKWLDSWVISLLDSFYEIKSRVDFLYRMAPSLNQFPDRRSYKAEVAKYYKENGIPAYASAFFARCDGRNVDPVIWKIIEPAGNDSITEGDEEWILLKTTKETHF